MTIAGKVGEAVDGQYKIALEYSYNAVCLKERKDCCWISLLLSFTNKKKINYFFGQSKNDYSKEKRSFE